MLGFDAVHLARAQFAFTVSAHGLNMLEHQPSKVAAKKGLFETTQGAPMALGVLLTRRGWRGLARREHLSPSQINV